EQVFVTASGLQETELDHLALSGHQLLQMMLSDPYPGIELPPEAKPVVPVSEEPLTNKETTYQARPDKVDGAMASARSVQYESSGNLFVDYTEYPATSKERGSAEGLDDDFLGEWLFDDSTLPQEQDARLQSEKMIGWLNKEVIGKPGKK
ncbi:MAG: hypothetical protein V7677_08405, partial [Motiliproteus sp.]